ncbi:hypothetical protein Tco_0048566, partial [Tanacetum coccineum]
MDVRVQPTMSPGCSVRITEVAAMFDVAFRKRFSEEDTDEDEGDKSLDEGDESHELDAESCELEDESHGLDNEGRRVESDRLVLEEEATPEDLEDGTVYIDVPTYPPPAPPVKTPPSPEWSSGSLPISPAPSTVPSPISSPT